MADVRRAKSGNRNFTMLREWRWEHAWAGGVTAQSALREASLSVLSPSLSGCGYQLVLKAALTLAATLFTRQQILKLEYVFVGDFRFVVDLRMGAQVLYSLVKGLFIGYVIADWSQRLRVPAS